MWWFWWWLVFVLVFLVLPVSYGWAHRGWGPPSRRPRWPKPEDVSVEDELAGWGWMALAIWVVALFALLWFLFAFAYVV